MKHLPLFAALLVLAGCPSPSTTGPEGPKGETGATGPQGPKGDPGATGMTGAPGMNGATGAQGPAGPQGLQGAAGSVLVLDGGVVVGPPGSSVLVTPISAGGQPCATGGVRITQLSDAGITTLCNGDVGPVGPAGPVGANGASVTTTTLSVLSTQCATGGLLIGFPDGGSAAVCNGAIGNTGPQGAMGATGPQGNIGPQGLPGAQGLQGNAGPQGPVGNAGPQGPTGPQGPPGAVLYVDGGVLLANGVASGTRPVLVGYTSFTSTGNIGSRTIANQRCDAEFPGSRLCTSVDFRLARSNQTLPSTGAWLDFSYSTTSPDPDVSSGCNNFTSTLTYNVSVALPNGTVANNTSTAPNCASTLPLACCTTPLVRMRGYTAFTTTGNLGSRTVANQKCHAEFPGSHLCNSVEFRLARSAVTLPSTGAFLDFAYSTTSTDPDVSSGCNNFTSTLTYNVSVALPNGTVANNTSTAPNCASTLPLACCD